MAKSALDLKIDTDAFKMKEYKLVQEHTPTALSMSVGICLEHGWFCQGGVFVIAYPERTAVYLQAMVR